MESLKRNGIYTDVRSKALDSLESWIDRGITAAGIPPLQDRSTWRLDSAIFFNQNQSRAILMILTINHSSLDGIDIVFGVRDNRDWQFYFKSLPSMSLAKDPAHPRSFEKLSAEAVELALKEYYKVSCTINEKLFAYNIQVLKEKHKEFLNEK